MQQWPRRRQVASLPNRIMPIRDENGSTYLGLRLECILRVLPSKGLDTALRITLLCPCEERFPEAILGQYSSPFSWPLVDVCAHLR